MMPGPDEIYKCPECGNKISRGTLLSGNTFGARLYSDGRQIAPMLPEYPSIVKCWKCNAIFWITASLKVGEIEFGKSDEYYQEAEFLSIEDNFRAISSGLAKGPKKHLYIRQMIWWSFNDRVRNGEKLYMTDAEHESWESNCEQLLKLLKPKIVEQKIMIAELYRNLGNFEKCMEILSTLVGTDFDWIVEPFTKACSEKNTLVFEFVPA